MHARSPSLARAHAAPRRAAENARRRVASRPSSSSSSSSSRSSARRRSAVALATPRTTPGTPIREGLDTARAFVATKINDVARPFAPRAFAGPHAVAMSAVSVAAALVATTAAARFVAETIESFGMEKKRVVILGAGFAGMQAAIDLRSKCDVTVLDAKEYFEFVPGVLAAMAGSAPLRAPTANERDGERASEALTVPYDAVLGDKVKFACVGGRDVRVHEDAVVVDGTERFEYDELVLAPGSSYAGTIKSTTPKRKDRLKELAEARRSVMEGGKTVVVVGGGVVGVELAAELAELNARVKSKSEVVLLHSGPRLLDALPESVGAYASKALVTAGVKCCVNQTYDREGDVFVGRLNKNVVRADAVIVCAGTKAATDFLRQRGEDDEAINVPLDMIGRIRVDEGTRQVIGYENVYAVGDAACKHPDEMLASFAHWEAEYVSKRILCRGNEKKLRSLGPYQPPPRFMAISLGPFDGLAVWGDRILATGFLAACFKALVQLWFSNFMPAPYALFRRFPQLRRPAPMSALSNRTLANSGGGAR